MNEKTEYENKILKFWEENQIFQKLQKKNQGKKPWSFIDGPITANNPMGVHHAWGRTYKDLFQRYNAMQGFDERFQNGFDCQGLWVEVEVEKELGFKNKKDIENFGIEKFVNLCKERVLKYSKIQTEQSIRLGQWMDWENSYYTMSDENNYAIWHFLKVCHEKKYIYKGRDSVPWCPRCGTAISQHEILAEEYQEITHKSLYLKYPITRGLENTSFLVWTTTPWTIPANVSLAVHPDLKYGLYEKEGQKLIVLEKLGLKILDGFNKTKEFIGKDLIEFKYESPFDNLQRVKDCAKNDKLHTVIDGKDLVTEEEGTGIVHIAPGAGAEDYKLGKINGLPVIDVIDSGAVYLDGLGEFSGKNAKENPEIIIDYLKNLEDGKYLLKVEDYTHRYPTCWRCKTELVWRVVDEWYISMDKLRPKMIEATQKIKWLPSFGLEREIDWLNNMGDWLISKKRYWGLALPIYECQCGNFEVIGSKKELEERAVEGWDKFQGKSPHRPWVDNVKIKCLKCGEIVNRIKDVGNPWLDAGIVPYSTLKYFEDKKYFEKWFPAEFICESFPGQFKNWFYSLIAMSVVLEDKNPFETVLGYASVRDKKGEEMHKSKGNAIWFDDAVEKIGADTMRWMFVLSNPYENLKFGYESADEIYKRFLLIFKNVINFFLTYSKIDSWDYKIIKSDNILDCWINSLFNKLVKDVTSNLDKYEPNKAAKKIQTFVIEDFSTWYLRRSRKRKTPEMYSTLYSIVIGLLKLQAPFMPFITEEYYQLLKKDSDPESVHLCDWLQAGEIDDKLLGKMAGIRKLTEVAHAKRAEKQIRIRQPLSDAKINKKYDENIVNILKEEINVKEIIFDENQRDVLILNTEINEELKQEGVSRDIIRLIQDLRKKAGLIPGQKAQISYNADENLGEIFEKYQDVFQKETFSQITKDKNLKSKEYNIQGEIFWLNLTS